MIELLLAAENALSLGLLDQAERTYRQALDADPRNGIAAVGLARVALERGDEAGAHTLVRAALEIDPENATARRMMDRLDDVARHRGDGVVPAPAAPGATPGIGAAAEPAPGATPAAPGATPEAPAAGRAASSPEPARLPAAGSPSAATGKPVTGPSRRPANAPRRGLVRRLLRRP